MRILNVMIAAVMFMACSAAAAGAEEKNRYLKDAQKLYEENKHIESLKILNDSSISDGCKYYWILLNEQEIGIKAKKGIIKPGHDYYGYIEYAERHPDRFYFWEPGAHFYLLPSYINELTEHLLKDVPDNRELISKMFSKLADSYVMLSSDDEESMDAHKWDKIIDTYKKAYEYADGKEKDKIKKQIDKYEGLKRYYSN